MRELRRLNRLFEASMYALVVVPFLMILLGSGIGWAGAGLFAAALPASFWFHRRGLATPAQARWWNVLIILFVGGTGLELIFTETTLLDAGIRLVLVLTVIKLFSRLSERDELQIYALTFLMLSAATTVNEDLTFGLLFGLYVLIATFSLAVFHLRSELSDRPRLALYGGATLNRSYMAVLATISGLILSASLGIFFVFPRIGLGFFAQQSRDGVSVTGFSENVELGGHGTLRDNPQVVMRVEFPEGKWPDMEGIHWRTMTFDEYDGRSWARTSRRHGRMANPLGRQEGYDLSEAFRSGETRGRVQIYLEPLGTNVLPTIWPSQKIRLGTTEYVMPWGPRSGVVKVDRYGDLRHTIESELGVAYVLTVGTPPRATAELDEKPRDRYLQLPELSERVRNLASDILTEAEPDNPSRAAAVRDYLEANYAYTTDLPPVGADPVDAFLFETRRGHCEYFATTMVMLLRANGIHARLVNGFLGGEWNDVGGYLAVRQGDAHSWVEYWDPRRGWVQIDPTPAADSLPDATLLNAARQYWDTMRLNWTKWVIEYDLNAQIEVFRQMGRMLEPKGLMQGSDSDSDDEAEELEAADWRKALFVGGLLTLAFFAFLRVRRRLRRRDTRGWTSATATFWIAFGGVWFGWFEGFGAMNVFSGAAIVAIGVVAALFDPTRQRDEAAPLLTSFEAIERAAGKVEIERSTDEGPETFLRRIAAARPDLADELERFETWYLRARFSPRAVEREEVDRLRRLALRIARKLRKS